MENRIQQLIELCMNDQATMADRQALTHLLSKPENQSIAKNWLLHAYQTNTYTDRLPSAARNAMLKEIYESTEHATPIKPIKTQFNRFWVRFTAAASVLLLLTIGLYTYRHVFMDAPTDRYLAEIKPGSNKAVLIFADGQSIDLAADHEGIVIDSTITYTDGSVVSQTAKHVSKMTLATPNGGQYNVTLPDGSQVWLNAASSLQYPSRFDGDSRVVELTGEAYFEVATNKQAPFIVKTAHQEVKVLGTHFNINAYADEPSTQTTLLEGRVEVSELSNHNKQILIPGEQSLLQDEQLLKRKVDVSTAVAWKDGRFNFNGKDLEQVMRELARWYDIEVVYEGSVPSLEFWGGVYRNDDLETVLQILEANDVTYRLEGKRKLVISTKTK